MTASLEVNAALLSKFSLPEAPPPMLRCLWFVYPRRGILTESLEPGLAIEGHRCQRLLVATMRRDMRKISPMTTTSQVLLP